MVAFIRRLYAIGPILFALGFLTPLIAQIIERAGWTAPWDLSPLLFGLILAAVWGGLAQWRGRWL
ncbi:MAG: hypothetical protein ACE363_03405 [Alphaproteobacteria bacterium]